MAVIHCMNLGVFNALVSDQSLVLVDMHVLVLESASGSKNGVGIFFLLVSLGHK